MSWVQNDGEEDMPPLALQLDEVDPDSSDSRPWPGPPRSSDQSIQKGSEAMVVLPGVARSLHHPALAVMLGFVLVAVGSSRPAERGCPELR